jgi:hypothetical protein
MGKVPTRNWTVPEEWRTKRRCTTAAGTVVTVLILVVIFNATTTAASKSLPNTNNNSRGMLKLKLFQFQAKSTVLFELKFLFCNRRKLQYKLASSIRCRVSPNHLSTKAQKLGVRLQTVLKTSQSWNNS